MEISDQELEDVLSTHDHQDPSETIRKIYARYGLRHGVARVGDKTPLHGLAMHDIASHLPEAHFIHIIRDGRDVAASYRDLWFGPGKDPKATAVFWMWRIREIRQQARFVPNYLEVRYEALVTDPETVLREIGDFIGLPFDERQLRAHLTAEEGLKELQDVVRSHRTIPAEERRSIHRLTWKEPDPTRVGRWRVAMSADEVAGFERVAGEMLSDLGYARAEP